MSKKYMEKVSDEMLMALADGELDRTQARALQARLDRDPELAARYAIFADTAAALRAAFSQGEIRQELVDAIHAVESNRQSEADTIVPFRVRAAVWPLALAASLALGVGLGWGLKNGGATGLGDVAQAVADAPTGSERYVAHMGTARVLGSFETERGLCRLIALAPEDASAGRFVACRDAEDWVVALSVSDGAADSFSPASETGTEMIDIYLDSIGAGAALDPQIEVDHLR